MVPWLWKFGISEALKQVLAELGLNPYEVLVASGIGQAGKTPYYINTNAYNGLHERGVPVASIAKRLIKT